MAVMTEMVGEKLEQLAEAVVFCEPNDLVALADLHTAFDEVRNWGAEHEQSVVTNAATAATNLIEKLILSEADDPRRALEIVCDTVAGLQAIVRDGRDPKQVKFPAELEVAASGQDGAAPVAVSAAAPADTRGSALEGDRDLMGEFVLEAREHLDAADVSLLTLETEPKNEEAINAVFRAFHTIKGVAGFMGLNEIKSCAHEAENLLDKVRKGELELVGPVVDITFDAVDAIKRLIGNVADALASGGLLRREGSLPQLIQTISAVAAGDMSVVAKRELPVPVAPGKRLGEILVESSVASEKSVKDTITVQQAPQKLGELLVHSGQVAAREVALALRSQGTAPATAVQTLQVTEPVKVDSDRLDRLLDTIGELVIAESMVCQSQELQLGITPQLARQLNQLDKITRELYFPTLTALAMVGRLLGSELKAMDETVYDGLAELVNMVAGSAKPKFSSTLATPLAVWPEDRHTHKRTCGWHGRSPSWCRLPAEDQLRFHLVMKGMAPSHGKYGNWQFPAAGLGCLGCL